MTRTLLLVALGLLGLSTASSESASRQDAAREALRASFEANHIRLDLDAGVCAIPVFVEVRNDLLEYLLVAPNGAMHESMFMTPCDPEVLNAALLALGVSAGSNAAWAPKDPAPSADELAEGVSAYDVTLPAGDGFYLYATWREGDETYFYRIEDLLRDLTRSRSARRHRWIYLGSRMIKRPGQENEEFAARLEGNLINVSFFTQGNTLVTAALEECVEQTIWLPNAWLLPERESELMFLFSKERLERVPTALEEHVPLVDEGVDDGR